MKVTLAVLPFTSASVEAGSARSVPARSRQGIGKAWARHGSWLGPEVLAWQGWADQPALSRLGN